MESGELITQISSVLNSIPCGFVTIKAEKKDGDYEIVFINDYLMDCLGIEHTDDYSNLGIRFTDIIYPIDKKISMDSLDVVVDENPVTNTYRISLHSENPLWMLSRHQRLYYEGSMYYFITMISIEDFMQTEAFPKDISNTWSELANNINIGLAIFSETNGVVSTIAVNDALVSFANSIGTALDGKTRMWTPELLAALFNQNICTFCLDEDTHIVKHMIDAAKRNGGSNCRFRLRGSTPENTVYIQSTCCIKQINDIKYNFYVTFQNVTSQALFEKELSESKDALFELSYYDHLTNVQNRNAYTEKIDNIKKIARHNVGIAFADLNGLKKTNDLLGHIYGDQMIKQFAEILMKYFSKEEIFRISGDEFVIVRENVSKESFQNTMYSVIQDSISANNLASIGYIWKDQVSDLKRRANQAEEIMYVRKQQFHEYEAKEESAQHRILAEVLENDLLANKYSMYLHPRADVSTDEIHEAEALIRKTDDYGNIILPYEFIPQFEKEYLVYKLDYFMLDNACRFLSEYEATHEDTFNLTVNISKTTISDIDFFKNLTEIFNRYDFDHRSLSLEITQSGEKMDKMRLENYIKQIKEYGVTVALDDVGKDSSSLIMLTMEGIDTITIDRSLIAHYKYPKAGKLLKHMIGMSHELGLKVVAEGVETSDMKNVLSDMDCDQYQGFLISEPLSETDFKEKYL
ncbi:MAG: bifunctional diguanylate cyclase/phosphodiesterase [Lachnospiraceae bacterium]|nr:bifunctional diguanylate cyclase/phosphodiesterase [Lachnospiraceae bacterium]